MKTLLIAALAAAGANYTLAADLSQTEARSLCEVRIMETNTTQSAFEFERKSANGFRTGNYSFMFNYKAEENGDRVKRKVKCVVSKAGDVVALDVMTGRWSL